MTVITLDWTVLQVALVIMFFFIGLAIRAVRMFLWSIGLFFAWYGTEAIGPRLERLVNRFLSIGAAFINDFTGDPNAPLTTTVTAPQVEIASPDLPLWQIGFLLLVAIPIVIFTIRKWAGFVVGDKTLLGRIWGGVIASLSMVFLLGKLTEYWNRWVTAPGHSDPLANFSLRYVPSTPTIVFGGPPTSVNWEMLAGFAFLLIIGLFVGYAVWRTLKAVV